ncbi:E3 ubiquitin-protein ligase At3g02290-like [Lycium ferocissimum]|uniref:E3 ubiquitin-protein ligase At3g02290-like n=1 Tax=Lycium ferocissimum TaxID=112874 RepID=UPI00281653D6|nr:E3 ubiquitin-protein ligase At3g02290-like [Lycium ferocissimum]
MGAFCCCLRDEWEDLANPNSSMYRNCLCLRSIVQNFFHMYKSLFHRGQQNAISSPTLGTTSLDNSLCDMYRSPPRPLPYDADPRYFRLQRDGLVSRREKGSGHSHEETEPLRRSDIDDDSEYLSRGKKWNESKCEEGLKENNCKFSVKISAAETTTGFANIYSSSEDEDICPTCLEEYTEEDPKIMTKCFHHFHLACIYEWMERSDCCPVCGKSTGIDLLLPLVDDIRGLLIRVSSG